MKQANELALAFSRELTAIKCAVDPFADDPNNDDDTLHVETTGAGLAELYESIRNASQNAEENLLLMHAIRRFIERYFTSLGASAAKRSGEYLVIELTMSGYLENDSITFKRIDHMTDLIRQAVKLAGKLADKHNKKQIERWVVKPLSAGLESLLRDHRKRQALADLAYNYFLGAIDIEQIAGRRPEAYEATLYVAIQKALLGNDEAAIRLSLMERYGVSVAQPAAYVKFNAQIDTMLDAPLLDKLTRLVSRNLPVFNILDRAVASDSDLDQHLLTEKAFLGPYDAAIRDTYLRVNADVNRGIIRSVIFLIITKFIIGVALEVPYDLFVHGQVMWLALGVNLLLPPLYMIALRLTLAMPDARNNKALSREASRILYAPVPKRPFITGKKRQFGKIYNFVYAVMVIGVFAGVSWLLIHFAHFEWIHLLIFFIFISTASFLGFRLSRTIRDIEVGSEAQTTTSMVRDFLYMPFVVVGQKISETYSKINIVSRFLDMFIELPLKTILGFVRRWGNFMSAKKDEL